MGTLGQYLRAAREARGIDLRGAAQLTRISYNYLKALEDEDFTRLPGEVFVKGFLKNYGKFLNLDENELMKRYGELLPQQAAPAPVQVIEKASATVNLNASGMPLEPFFWGAGILIVLVLFLFSSLPSRKQKAAEQHLTQTLSTISTPTTTMVASTGPLDEKLYLEVVALESTWVLVRTDASPQKKALLKQGESLIWSASERFVLSYGSAGSVQLLLNGKEVTVNEPRTAVVRDLVITAAGILNRKPQIESYKPARPKPMSQPATTAQRAQPVEQSAPKPSSTAAPASAAPAPVPEQPKPAEEQRPY
jgi:cytoskeletal protein RodZ